MNIHLCSVGEVLCALVSESHSLGLAPTNQQCDCHIWRSTMKFFTFLMLILASTYNYAFAAPTTQLAYGGAGASEFADITGIDYQEHSMPSNAFALLNATTGFSVGLLQRYPPRLQQWSNMTEKTAYYRDALVGQWTNISGATDGDSWHAVAVDPNGVKTVWQPVTFHNQYNGYSNCFVSPSWYLCGSTSISIRWYHKSQCGAIGTWNNQFYRNNVLVGSDTWEMLEHMPEDKSKDSVPLMAQRDYGDPTNPAHIYDHTNLTIGSRGCALTSAAMVLSYHGIDTDPVKLNEWLKQHGGFDSTGGIYMHKALTDYSKDMSHGTLIVNKLGIVKKSYFGVPNPFADDQLSKDICQYGPQIMKINYDDGHEHNVVAVGRIKRDENWGIADSVDGTYATMKRWDPTYAMYTQVAGPEYTFTDIQSSLTIRFHSPGQLVLTDPLGRKLGYDPILQKEYHEIPNGSYNILYQSALNGPPDQDPTKELDLPVPQEGEYTLTITGTGTGSYDLDVLASSRDLTYSSLNNITDVPINTGEIHSYVLNYSRDPGRPIELSGTFYGKGQRPKDVNKFLVYIAPMSSPIRVPSAESSYTLILSYSRQILPETFVAELNGMDITDLFTPAPGGVDHVTLSLGSGRNVLTLSTDGLNNSGRTSTDHDRLVFLVE